MRARSLALAAALATSACGFRPDRPFEREAPAVREAIAKLDAGRAAEAADELMEYLSTGPCRDGSIGTPERLRLRPHGTFDLGLALFRVGEQFGARFGDEELDAGGQPEQRRLYVACARAVVRAITGDDKQPVDLRARAHYLEANLGFLDGDYGAAVAAYDRALTLVPGDPDASDPLGRDAAWNRAIALRRKHDEDRPPDAGSPDGAVPDAGPQDGGHGDGGPQRGDGGGPPQRPSPAPEAGAPNGGDEEPDGGAEPPPPRTTEPDAGPPPPSRANQDERMLDSLENAPTVQQEAAKKQARRRTLRAAEDR